MVWTCAAQDDDTDVFQVSDIYVRLGNGFELCVAAFRRVGISTA